MSGCVLSRVSDSVTDSFSTSNDTDRPGSVAPVGWSGLWRVGAAPPQQHWDSPGGSPSDRPPVFVGTCILIMGER